MSIRSNTRSGSPMPRSISRRSTPGFRPRGSPRSISTMPVWTPGFYRVEDHAGRVQSLVARTQEGTALEVAKAGTNRWQVATNGSPVVLLTYRLLCQGRSVTTNWVDETLGVINGAAAFITLAENARRPHDILIEMPSTWQTSVSGLDAAPGGQPNHYRAADFDTLVDSPIVAGTIDIHQFVVDASTHVIADAGDHPSWDGQQAARSIETMVREARKYWGPLPFKRYVFLNVFRQGGGGPEHGNSTLLTSSPKSTKPTRSWLSFVAHEYVHRLQRQTAATGRTRPLRLRKASHDDQPVVVGRCDDLCGQPDTRPCRPHHTNRVPRHHVVGHRGSPEGARTTRAVPGAVLGRSLDQQQLGRRRKRGHRQLLRKGERRGVPARRAHPPGDQWGEVVRRCHPHGVHEYGGERGFTADELRGTFEEVAGHPLKAWFAKAIESPGEVDYGEMLAWYGLRFAGGDKSTDGWILEVRPKATGAQRRHLAALLSSPRATLVAIRPRRPIIGV